MRIAKAVARSRLIKATAISDDTKRRDEVKWSMASESLPRIEAMLRLAESERPLADDGSQWDTNHWLLGVANGVVDLHTGHLRPGTPADSITLHSPIPFDPAALCPRWDQFLTEIFPSDLIPYIHRAIGYTLTGDTSEQCFFCCHGEGANGKSTFLNTIRHCLGGYACNLPFSAFELQTQSATSNDIATLPGSRFATAIETDESVRLNEARIKALTGGDYVTARQLYREFFTFKPIAKFWLAFNHRPLVADDSHGFWRRLHQIPFSRQFDAGSPTADPDLEAKLGTESPGILAWAIQGCLAWKRQRLDPPALVKEATQAYREESDPLRDFITERLVIHPKAQVSAAGVWLEYTDWCKENSERHPLGRLKFARRLESIGAMQTRHGHAQTRTWMGVCRRQDASSQHLTAIADVQTHAD